MAKKKPYRFFLYWAARFAAGLISLLPRTAALSLARWAGKAAFKIAGRQRTRTLAHLTAVYGQEKSAAEIEALGKKVFENSALTAVEILQFPEFRRTGLEKIVETDEASRVYDQLLAEGRGLISITAHLGNWELLAGAIVRKGYKAIVLARKIYYEPYNRWIVGLRRQLDVQTVYRDHASREIFKKLADNEIVGLLPDQDVDSLKGVFVPFFGRPAYTMVAPVRLALSSGAPILPNFLVRDGKDRYRIILGKVIRPVIEITREEAVLKYTEEWMRQFENVIRRYPEQWAWMHDRWKTRPEEKSEARISKFEINSKSGSAK